MTDFFDACQCDGYTRTPDRDKAIRKAVRLVTKDHRQRWVTMDSVIHETPVPYRDAWSIRYTGSVVIDQYRSRKLAHPAT